MNQVPLSLIIARRNPLYRMYYSIKAVATARADINNIGIKITLLLNRSVIINNVLTPDLALKRRSVIKSINISYQIH